MTDDPLRARRDAKRAAKRHRREPEPEPPADPPRLVIAQGARSRAMPPYRAAITPDEAIRAAVWELRGRPKWVRL